MNLQPLFTTARVMSAVYKIVTTALLLSYLLNRKKDDGRIPNGSRRRAITRGDRNWD